MGAKTSTRHDDNDNDDNDNDNDDDNHQSHDGGKTLAGLICTG
jgi:hypothetical protein